MAECSSSSRAHQARGLGYSSRFCVSEDDLPIGWRCEKKSSKYTVWYDDKGNRYKSSVAVQRALEERRRLLEDSDDETVTGTGGETSEFELSPVKRPRTEAAM